MGKRYPIRLWRNYVNQSFCPVYWLITYIMYFKLTSGPLFQKDEAAEKKEGGAPTPTGENMSPDQWTTMTDRIFHAVTAPHFESAAPPPPPPSPVG